MRNRGEIQEETKEEKKEVVAPEVKQEDTVTVPAPPSVPETRKEEREAFDFGTLPVQTEAGAPGGKEVAAPAAAPVSTGYTGRARCVLNICVPVPSEPVSAEVLSAEIGATASASSSTSAPAVA